MSNHLLLTTYIGKWKLLSDKELSDTRDELVRRVNAMTGSKSPQDELSKILKLLSEYAKTRNIFWE